MVDHAPLGMSRLAPGIGVEKVDAIEACVGQPLDHVKRVAHVEAHIVEVLVADMPERPDDAIEERLAPEKAMIRPRRRLGGKVFARPEADLELHRPILAEQQSGGEAAILRHGHARQHVLDQRCLSGAQLMPLGAAIQAAELHGFVHLRALAAHGARVNRANLFAPPPVEHPMSKTKPEPPPSARQASAIEHADARIAAALGTHHDHPVIEAAGIASEIADQPPLIMLTAATALAGLVLRKPTLARAGLRMLASELVATGLKTRIKHRIDRTRPHKMLDEGRYVLKHADESANRDGPWSSFPSGHTAGAVAVARALTRDYPQLAVPAAVAAAGVAAIQLPSRKHFPTDVIAGAAIGWVAETIVSGAIRALSRRRRSVRPAPPVP